MNSATEISTDSEFEQDPIIRETPQIFIDDTHLKRPTKVQVFVTYISNKNSSIYYIKYRYFFPTDKTKCHRERSPTTITNETYELQSRCYRRHLRP